MALLNKASELNFWLESVCAKEGNAETIDSSSLMALAASVAMYSSESFKKTAIFGLANLLSTKTAAVRKALLVELLKAKMASSLPILVNANTAA